MKTTIFKYIFSILIILLNGCTSSTQMSSYKPTEGGESWRVNVVQKSSFTKFMTEYICLINDSAVVTESFPVTGGRSFVKRGNYRGKTVVMNGYKRSITTTSYDGKESYDNIYEIRVLIDDELVDKFEF